MCFTWSAATSGAPCCFSDSMHIQQLPYSSPKGYQMVQGGFRVGPQFCATKQLLLATLLVCCHCCRKQVRTHRAACLYRTCQPSEPQNLRREAFKCSLSRPVCWIVPTHQKRYWPSALSRKPVVGAHQGTTISRTCCPPARAAAVPHVSARMKRRLLDKCSRLPAPPVRQGEPCVCVGGAQTL